ncbi:hypothetical protein V2W45_234103 [Cenococcum geophilum]
MAGFTPNLLNIRVCVDPALQPFEHMRRLAAHRQFFGRTQQSRLLNLAPQFQVYGDLLHFIRDLRVSKFKAANSVRIQRFNLCLVLLFVKSMTTLCLCGPLGENTGPIPLSWVMHGDASQLTFPGITYVLQGNNPIRKLRRIRIRRVLHMSPSYSISLFSEASTSGRCLTIRFFRVRVSLVLRNRPYRSHDNKRLPYKDP